MRRLWARLRGSPGGSAELQPTPPNDLSLCVDAEERQLVEACLPFTMTSPARLLAVLDAVDHVVARGIPGAIAECGVWRGGSALMAVLALQRRGVDDRDVYLFDTFEGMSEPTDLDTSRFDPPALRTWEAARREGAKAWSHLFDVEGVGTDEVRRRLVATGYPAARIHLVEGKVEDTIPASAPTSIAVLRLDTDWYESTRHELEHLYPRLERGGVLLVDDYGHWDGCRRAVDEFFGPDGGRDRILLARTDYTGRLGIKA